MYTHACIKCKESYQDEHDDAYYCAECNEERLKVAREIDAKMANRRSHRVAPSFDEQMAALPRIPGTNIPFIQ